jgi:hypothetical protein
MQALNSSIQIMSHLQDRYYGCLKASKDLTEEHESLPELFSTTVINGGRTSNITVPSFFKIASSIHLLNSSLKTASQLFDEEVALPNIRQFLTEFDEGRKPLIFALTEGLFDPVMEFPHLCVLEYNPGHVPDLDTDESIELVSSLVKWTEASFSVLCQPDVVLKGLINSDDLFVLIKVLSTVKELSHIRLKSLYFKFANILTGLSIFRFGKLVVCPTLADLQKSSQQGVSEVTNLLEAMKETMDDWMIYCTAELPRLLDVSIRLFFFHQLSEFCRKMNVWWVGVFLVHATTRTNATPSLSQLQTFRGGQQVLTTFHDF